VFFDGAETAFFTSFTGASTVSGNTGEGVLSFFFDSVVLDFFFDTFAGFSLPV
jgi:hypothetical protein